MNKKLIIIFAVLVLLAIGYYGYNELKGKFSGLSDENTVATSTKRTVEIAPGIFAEVEGDEMPKVEIVPIVDEKIKAPTLNRPIVIPISMTEESGKFFTAKIEELKTKLRKDPGPYDDWLNLGIYLKQIEDYNGAEEILVYLIKAAPGNAMAYINLGDLYTYYFHDNVKAEATFLKVVEVAPRWLEVYSRITDFYVTALQDKAKAKSFLEASVAKYPDMKPQIEPLLKTI
ncbi:MAG: hypothetical protein WC673_00560 [Candidatus Paceibacterota bacterium]|jgi:tetratricopeptide (TPR) repeat protein